MPVKYRPEIDGLRAIAVMAVILFHIHIPGFTGGYIGVDVFFVISGYLITSIILAEHQQGNFSILGFYKRRIRRIIPVAIAVNMVVLCISYLLFDSAAYLTAIHTIRRFTLFVSNVLFIGKQDYFDVIVPANPLLHTWSLSVEEQFYIVYPFLMLLLLRWGKRLQQWSLLAIAVLSLVLNLVLTQQNNNEAFFFSHTRAWEFLTGAILANYMLTRPHKAHGNNILQLAALALLMVGVFMYGESLSYPGHYALLPVLATVLLIYASYDSKAIIARFLSSKPLVFTGRISYSLYMWHWPILVFANYLSFDNQSAILKIPFLCFVFIIAYLSYKYIEQPFRLKEGIVKKYHIALLGSMTIIVFSLAYAIRDNKHGIAANEYKQYQKTKEQDTTWAKMRNYDGLNLRMYTAVKPYKIGADSARPVFLLWGDSHARMLISGFEKYLKDKSWSGYAILNSGMLPLTDIDVMNKGILRDKQLNDNALSFLQKHPELKIVILVARWNYYYNTGKSKFERTNTMKFMKNAEDNTADENSLSAQRQLFKQALDTTVRKLTAMGRKLIITTPLPEMNYQVNQMLIIKKLFHKDLDYFNLSRATYLQENKEVLDILKAIRDKYKITLVPYETAFLQDNHFAISDGKTFYYRDDNHLSPAGASVAVDFIGKYLSD